MKRPRIADAIDHVSTEALSNGTQLAPAGSVLVVVRGMILAHSLPVAVATAPVAFNQDIKALVPKPGFDSEFILYWLQARREDVLALVDVANHGTKRLPSERLFGLEAPHPPLSEQRKIVAILSSVDEAIEKTKAVIDQLQVVKKAMMQELLSRGIPGRHAVFKHTEIGITPDEWAFATLRNVCVQSGLQTGPFGSQLKADEYVESGVPVIMPKDIVEQRVSTASIARIPEFRAAQLAQHRLLPGDLLFARRGDIGRCAVIREEEAGWVCGTGCLRARLNGNVEPTFLVRLFEYEPVLKWLIGHAVGQTMLNLNTDILGAVPVMLPTLGEQREIDAALSSIDVRLLTTRGTLDAMSRVKSALMSVLLTGEVRVTPDPEPSP